MTNMRCGIYQIRNVVNEKRYIGSARNIYNRWWRHRYLLERGRHHSIYLQRAWDKYGADAFEFHILLFCDVGDLLFYEQRLLDCMQPQYNISIVAGAPTAGKSLSEKHRMRLSELNKGEHHPQYGKKRSNETRRKLSMANLGKKQTAETIKKISQALSGRNVTEETRIKIGKGNQGKVRSAETLQRLSDSHRGKRQSTDTIEKRKVSRQGYRHSQATIEKISMARKGHSVSEETRDKLSNAVRQLWENGTYAHRGVAA